MSALTRRAGESLTRTDQRGVTRQAEGHIAIGWMRSRRCVDSGPASELDLADFVDHDEIIRPATPSMILR
jgi:hypothetical protein